MIKGDLNAYLSLLLVAMVLEPVVGAVVSPVELFYQIDHCRVTQAKQSKAVKV